MKLRILIAEDHGLVRAALRGLVEGQPGMEVVGEAEDGNSAVRLTGQLHPDVVLMDVSMPGLNGLEATRRVSKQHPRTRVLMLSMHADREYVRQALAAGAGGYLLKDADAAELELALRAVARGDLWLSPAISRKVAGILVRGARAGVRGAGLTEKLTARQREVLQLIAEGHSTREIAHRLRISVKTVETHRAHIMERLDVHHVAGLVRYAIRARIVRPES